MIFRLEGFAAWLACRSRAVAVTKAFLDTTAPKDSPPRAAPFLDLLAFAPKRRIVFFTEQSVWKIQMHH
jgi:hypothetical protein